MRDEADASCGSRSRATTKSSEDYLEAILVIRRLRGSCRNVDIAERMGVAKPSVTKALGNLARRGPDETRAMAGKRRAACRPDWATGSVSDTAH